MTSYKEVIVYNILDENLVPLGFGKPDIYIQVEDFDSLYDNEMRTYLKNKYGNFVGVLVATYPINFDNSPNTHKGIIGVI